MKQLFFIVTSLLLLLSSCEELNNNGELVTDDLTLSVNITSLEMRPGDSYKIEPEVQPVSRQIDIVYSSSSPAIATVDADGTIKAIAPGLTEIVARLDYLYVGCHVIVKTVDSEGDAESFTNEDEINW